MDKFEALTHEASNTRLVELYQILETYESKNVGEIYDDMKMARKIMLNRYNKFSVIGVTIRGVCFYNNNSDRLSGDTITALPCRQHYCPTTHKKNIHLN